MIPTIQELRGQALTLEDITPEDPIRVHASGFIHMRYLLQRDEYLVGIVSDLKCSSSSVAEKIGSILSSQHHRADLSMASKRQILYQLRDHFGFEYDRRCGRHAFYAEAGYGGRAVIQSIKKALEALESRGRGKAL